METKIRIFAILASILMLIIVAVPMIGAETDYGHCNNYNELVKIMLRDDIKIPTSPRREILDTPLQLIEIHPEIKRSVPHPHLIIASVCNDRQKLIFEAIEKYSETSEKEQEYLKKFMKYLWEKYPVTYKTVNEFYLVNKGIWQPFYKEKKYIDRGDVKSNYIVTLYQFDMDKIDAQNIKLTDAENEMLEKVWESLLRRILLRPNHNNTDEILWRGDVHYVMTKTAVIQVLGPSFHCFANRAAYAARNPDCMDWIRLNQYNRFKESNSKEQILFDAVLHLVFNSCRATTLHKWTHSYINIGTILYYPFSRFGWVGGAPDEAKHFGSIARALLNEGNWNDAANNFGYASHFLTDVGQPMHTGGVLRQAILYQRGDCIHSSRYYNFIANNWYRGHNFKHDVVGGDDTVRNFSCPYYATQHLAGYSNRLVNTIIWGITHNPNWENCPIIINYTGRALTETMRWNRGLVRYVFQG